MHPYKLSSDSGRRKVRWVIAHFPIELFMRAAKAFTIELEKLCPKQFDIEIHTKGSYLRSYSHLFTKEELATLDLNPPRIPGLEDPSQTNGNRDDAVYASKFMDIRPSWQAFFQAMKDGKFELCQTQVNIIGSHLHQDFHAIDLPYLFNDHDHVSRVLDGEIGDRLSDQVAAKTGVRALGYTYSGGYRIIGSTEGITSLDDLQSKKFVSFTAPSTKLFQFAGVNHISRFQSTAEDVADMTENGGAIETTYLRFAGKNILKTNHSMFMTSILTSEDFMSSLTAEQQAAFKEAAHRVARLERTWSVEDAAKYEEQAQERGITIVPIGQEDDARLREASRKVYNKEILDAIGVDASLVTDIMKLGNK
jgi:TRAP-type C4-dicarboxylate transport system substrate-binding protein